jgi:hypothetical protein
VEFQPDIHILMIMGGDLTRDELKKTGVPVRIGLK